MAGIAETVQALEAIKMALGLEWCASHDLKPLLGRLWLLDARTMQHAASPCPLMCIVRYAASHMMQYALQIPRQFVTAESLFPPSRQIKH